MHIEYVLHKVVSCTQCIMNKLYGYYQTYVYVWIFNIPSGPYSYTTRILQFIYKCNNFKQKRIRAKGAVDTFLCVLVNFQSYNLYVYLIILQPYITRFYIHIIEGLLRPIYFNEMLWIVSVCLMDKYMRIYTQKSLLNLYDATWCLPGWFNNINFQTVIQIVRG